MFWLLKSNSFFFIFIVWTHHTCFLLFLFSLFFFLSFCTPFFDIHKIYIFNVVVLFFILFPIQLARSFLYITFIYLPAWMKTERKRRKKCIHRWSLSNWVVVNNSFIDKCLHKNIKTKNSAWKKKWEKKPKWIIKYILLRDMVDHCRKDRGLKYKLHNYYFRMIVRWIAFSVYI